MNLATMFSDVWSAVFHRPATQRYPFQQTSAPVQLRGKLHWKNEGCTGCALCIQDCPAEAIELMTLDKKAKRFAMRYDADRCTFCGQCLQSCRFDCFTLSSAEWELASLKRGPFSVIYGNEADVEQVKAGLAANAASGTPAP
jgi:formate hydrogenlyase subunit 6/NADH:ubiquinone oxidoreductase subunit I